MTELYECPVEGCTHPPFKTPQARSSHIRSIHPEYEAGGGEAREVPIVEEDFAKLLQKYKIKVDLAANIAEHISHTGGPSVFEKPELLLKGLVAWSSDIAPSKRKLIIERWFAEKQIAIPPEVQQTAGMTTEQLDKVEEEPKGGAEVRYVFDEEKKVVRMAKKDERGGTLAQAKELKKMAEEDESGSKEPAFVMGEQGAWTLNPKAKIGIGEFAVFQMYQDSVKKGEPIDPVEELARREETSQRLKEAWGVKGGGDGGTLETIQTLSALGLIRKPGEEESSGLKEALAEMRKSVDEMKEQRYRDQFAGQQRQMQEITNVLNRTIETISDLQKNKGGKTEMDIIHEIIEGGKTELSGLRKDVKEAFASGSLPPGKSAEEREGRKQRVKKALKADEEIEELGKRLFFPQG
ncbi:hypothetical protein ES703_24835 [subsurface metagenome]